MSSVEEIALASRGQSSALDDRDGLQSRFTSLRSADSSEVDLPKVDGGTRAWLFLAGCFVVEALIWGFPFSFGIFKDYYSTHEPFSSAPSGITVIGTSAMGVMYLGAPIISTLLVRYPKSRRMCQIIGLTLMVGTLIASSYASKVWHLILTQGILYGIGGNLVYLWVTSKYISDNSPTIDYMDEWFVNRKGFALGIMWAGTGVGGIAIPFIMDWGLRQYALATMLRAWAIVLIILATPLLFFVRERIPISARHGRNQHISYHFMLDSTFLILQFGNVCEGMGFFIPNIYLPTYAADIGLSSVQGTVTVALFNAASVFGAVMLGSLCDRFHVTSIMTVSSVGATLAVLIWGFSSSLAPLCIFSLLYGLFAGGYSSTWSGVSREVKRKDDRAQQGIVLGLLAAGRGIGSVISGPLSEALVAGKPWQGHAHGAYGYGYGPLIIFTGLSALFGGSGWLGRRLGWI